MVQSFARSGLLQRLQAISEQVTQMMVIWPGQSVQKSGNMCVQITPHLDFSLKERKNLFVDNSACFFFLLFPWNGTRIRACPISQASAQFILLLLCIFVNLHLLFAFFFSSYKWSLALSTKNLEVNVLRQEDLSFVTVKLTEISFTGYFFSYQFHYSCQSWINLSWLLPEEKDFYSNAISGVLLSRPTRAVQ